ncbi:MAG: GNAT family N-acetyltransferase [Casimicrobiaceae bacterium]
MTLAQAPGRVELRRIEEASLNGLQTQRQLFYDGWLLRLSPGRAKRARSVNAHFASTLPLARKIAYCELVYAERRLPALFRITPFVAPRELEAELIARGYQPFQPTLVQTLQLERPPDVACPPDVEFAVPSVPEFVAAVGEMQAATAEQRAAHLERLAQSPLTTRVLLAFSGGRPMASGQAAIEEGLVGVFSVATEPSLRRRGIGSALTAALLTWAWERGAHTAYLQVAEDNHRARSMYRRLGFATAYTYHYRGRPGEDH